VAYIRLELAPSTPPAVDKFVRRTIEDLYFSDVHAMLRLPVPHLDITAGQNFSIAQVLMSVISSVSVCLYSSQGESGDLFKEAIEKYFPWDRETGSGAPKAAAGIIYDVFRNPLTHNAGLYLDWRNDQRYLVQKNYEVKIKRWLRPGKTEGLTEDWIENLEKAQDRPATIGPTLQIDASRRVLLVEGLYWCTRRMIENLSRDEQRMQNAARFLQAYT
jgi:hypothetical protein